MSGYRHSGVGMTTQAPEAMQGWRKAFDAQMKQWAWQRTPKGITWQRYHFKFDTQDMNSSTQQMLARLYEMEASVIENADPIYVSQGMCEVIDVAKDSFQPEPLIRSDLLVDVGFMYFEKSFQIPDRFQHPVNVKALSWAPMIASDEERTGDALERWRANDTGGLTGISICIYSATSDESGQWLEGDGGRPEIVPIHHTPWWFDMTFDGNELDANHVPTGAEWWWRIAQTSFRLMQQRISSKSMAQSPRVERRAAERLKFPIRDTLVVRLRRESTKPQEGHVPEPANYSHRFLVSGHWRNQFYPSLNMHRQIWISPYVKGPEGTELIAKTRRAFQWDR